MCDPGQPMSTWAARVPVPTGAEHQLDSHTTYGNSFARPAITSTQAEAQTSHAADAWAPSPNALSSATTYRETIEATAREPHPATEAAPQAQLQQYPGLHAAAPTLQQPASTYTEAYTAAPPQSELARLASCIASKAGSGVQHLGGQRYKYVPNQNKLEGPSVYDADFVSGKLAAGKLRCDNVWTQLQPNPYLAQQ